jgi:hypothetical protein
MSALGKVSINNGVLAAGADVGRDPREGINGVRGRRRAGAKPVGKET